MDLLMYDIEIVVPNGNYREIVSFDEDIKDDKSFLEEMKILLVVQKYLKRDYYEIDGVNINKKDPGALNITPIDERTIDRLYIFRKYYLQKPRTGDKNLTQIHEAIVRFEHESEKFYARIFIEEKFQNLGGCITIYNDYHSLYITKPKRKTDLNEYIRSVDTSLSLDRSFLEINFDVLPSWSWYKKMTASENME